jgi:hypothetical protein
MIGTAAAAETTWFKGNTHTHTNRSDGDSSPSVVASWYRDHGYNFLVISDHNVLVDPEELRDLQTEEFILIRGEEVSARHQKLPVHLNGIDVDHVVEPINDRETMADTIQANVDAIHDAHGLPHINHPNFYWAISHLDLLKVENYRLLEIYNGHPLVNNLGGSGHPSMEEVWDYLLTEGRQIYGIAVDDAHHFQEEFASHRANPGKGWLMVRAEKLDKDAILKAIGECQFYASTGVVLDDIATTAESLTITIKERRNFGYRVEFIGVGGKVLKATEENPAVYNFQGNEQYVRAKIHDSNGGVAWVQPVFPAAGAQ